MDIASNKKFGFEDKNTDFPFYTGESKFRKTDIILLLIGLAINLIFLYFISIPYILELGYLLYFLIILYITRGKLGLIFKKLRLNDFGFIILGIIGHFILSIAFIALFEYLQIPTSNNPVSNMSYDLIFWITFVFDMFGEEFFKIIVFLLTLYFVYKFSQNRKVSVFVAAFITLFCFGLIHYGTYTSILQSIIVIGCVFEMLVYIKTHNIWTTLLIHLLYDIITFLPNF